MDEEEIKDLIDERIDERIEQKMEEEGEKPEEEPEDGLDRLIDERLAEKYGAVNRDSQSLFEDLQDDEISRRSFLKALGLGAGGLALASPVSGAWAQLKASTLSLNNNDPSDIDADTVDGKDASEIGGGSIRRNDQGAAYVVNQSSLSSQVTLSPQSYHTDSYPVYTTNAGSSFSQNLQTTLSGVSGNYASVSADIPGPFNGASGTIKLDLYRNGNTISSGDYYNTSNASISTSANITNDNITGKAYVHLTDSNTTFGPDIHVRVTGQSLTGATTLTMTNNSSMSPAFLDWTAYGVTNGTLGTANKAKNSGYTLNQKGWMTSSLSSNRSLTLQSISYSNITTTTTFTGKWTLKEGTYL